MDDKECEAPESIRLRVKQLGGCDFIQRMEAVREQIKARHPLRCGLIPNEEVILEMTKIKE